MKDPYSNATFANAIFASVWVVVIQRSSRFALVQFRPSLGFEFGQRNVEESLGDVFLGLEGKSMPSSLPRSNLTACASHVAYWFGLWWSGGQSKNLESI